VESNHRTQIRRPPPRLTRPHPPGSPAKPAFPPTRAAPRSHRFSRGRPRRLWVHQLINVAWVAIHRHDFDRARQALEEYLDAGSWKNPVGIANGHGNLGLVAVYQHDRDEADSHYRQALALARAPRATPTIAEVLFGLGAVAAMDGDDERAVRLWGAAVGLKAAMKSPLSAPEQFIVESYLEPAGGRLSEDARERVRDEGNAMSLEEAVAYALDEEPRP
jgi:tetratricopeptide (TPR) repeat protein